MALSPEMELLDQLLCSPFSYLIMEQHAFHGSIKVTEQH